jgi:DNA-directed RNA polymerase subunit RPC12/RpoP
MNDHKIVTGKCIQCGETFCKRTNKDVRCIDCRLEVIAREEKETPDVLEFMENTQIDQAWNYYNE